VAEVFHEKPPLFRRAARFLKRGEKLGEAFDTKDNSTAIADLSTRN